MPNKYKQLSIRLLKYSVRGMLVQCLFLASALVAEASTEENVNYTVAADLQQELTVTGKVTSEDGEGLPGVTIKIKSTGQGTTTNIDGTYRVKVPDEGAVLVFSFIGYKQSGNYRRSQLGH